MICRPGESPLGHVALDARATSHLVLKGSKLACMIAAASAEMRLCRRSILRDGLFVEARACIVCLMLVKLFGQSFTRCSLRESPARHVLLLRSVGRELRGVPTRTNRCRSGRVILESTTSAVTEGVLGCTLQLRLILWVVLRARILLEIVWLHL